MHQGNRDFLSFVSQKYSHEVSGAAILEIGSMDWNGTARPYFAAAARYVGVDHCAGAAVDIVCQADQTAFKPGEFDILICLSVFEHDPEWRQILPHNLRWVKDGGLVILCWGAEGNLRHAPEPWAIVPVADFDEASKALPMMQVDAFFEGTRFTKDCPGCYDVVARKISSK